jgi:hypothetical protein
MGGGECALICTYDTYLSPELTDSQVGTVQTELKIFFKTSLPSVFYSY